MAAGTIAIASAILHRLCDVFFVIPTSCYSRPVLVAEEIVDSQCLGSVRSFAALARHVIEKEPLLD